MMQVEHFVKYFLDNFDDFSAYVNTEDMGVICGGNDFELLQPFLQDEPVVSINVFYKNAFDEDVLLLQANFSDGHLTMCAPEEIHYRDWLESWQQYEIYGEANGQ